MTHQAKRVEPTNPELERRALSAYYRYGHFPAQPGSVEYVELDERHYVLLRNADGILAVYRVRTRGQLKRLTRWPDALKIDF